MKPLLILIIISATVIFAAVAQSGAAHKAFKFNVEINDRLFFEEGIYPGQKRHYISLAFQPEFYVAWAGGKQSIKFSGFARIDQHDQRRNHLDIRELYWNKRLGPNEISAGFKKVFWGKTEANHLVDIINQTDLLEGFNREEKLGELMLQFSRLSNFGTLDLFFMPYFRKQVFPGRSGRLRPGNDHDLVIDSRKFDFENQAERWHPSRAVRWSHYMGRFDLGASYFYGTGRDPVIIDLKNFDAFYGIIHQVGLDMQSTIGPLLYKLEAVYRHNDRQEMFAFDTGFEYTFSNIASSGIDVGIMAEYIYDSREDLSLSGLQNDLFTGLRVSINDVQGTQFMMGSILDLERTSRQYFIEGKRRIGKDWVIKAESHLFDKVDKSEIISLIRKDSFVQTTLIKYF